MGRTRGLVEGEKVKLKVKTKGEKRASQDALEDPDRLVFVQYKKVKMTVEEAELQSFWDAYRPVSASPSSSVTGSQQASGGIGVDGAEGQSSMAPAADAPIPAGRGPSGVSAIVQFLQKKTPLFPPAAAPTRAPAAAAAAAAVVAAAAAAPASAAPPAPPPAPLLDVVALAAEAVPEVVVQNPNLDPNSFPPDGLVLRDGWKSMARPLEEEPDGLLIPLPNFGLDASASQTLTLRMTVPAASQSCAFNILPRDHSNFGDVLYHFNIRRSKHKLVQNTCTKSSWDDKIETNLNAVIPSRRDETFDINVQITEMGFHVGLNGECKFGLRDRGLLRKALADNVGELLLQIVKYDAYTKVQNVIVHQVWWGHKKPIPGADIVELADGKKTQTSELIVRGLPGSDPEAVQAELLRVFTACNISAAAGSAARSGTAAVPCKVSHVARGNYAFVEMRSPEAAARAMAELKGRELLGATIAVDWARGTHNRR